MSDVLAGWERSSFSAAGFTHDTYRKGSGPGVIVIHEIPGITPKVTTFADDVADRGFTVVEMMVVIALALVTAVLVLLSFLAGVIRGLTALFPHIEPRDAAVLAAIASAAASAYPGTKVTDIQEHR